MSAIERAFKTALGTCGFNTPTVALLCRQAGVYHCIGLLLCSPNDIDLVMKICAKWKHEKIESTTHQVPDSSQVKVLFVAQRKFKAFYLWTVVQVLTGTTIPVASGFDASAINMMTAHMSTVQTDRKGSKDDEALPLPDKFKNWGKWREFQEDVILYLKQCRSEGPFGVFLIYLTRKHENPSAAQLGASYDTLDAQLLSCVKLGKTQGKYNNLVLADLKSLFYIIVKLMTGTLAYAQVKRHMKTKDGRAAWISLVAQGDGPAAQTMQKTQARDEIKRAVCTGKSNFSFQAYSTIHSEAHEELERPKEPVPETQKVSDFPEGIQCSYLATHKAIYEGDAKNSRVMTHASSTSSQ